MVPQPENGSRTLAPGLENRATRVAAIAGFILLA
jgi:hypothetical protein